MHPEPILDDPDDPLISVLVYNYEGRYLKECLAGVFGQNELQNLEIIYIDDATTDGSWEVALEFAEQHASHVTIGRNKRVLGPEVNGFICRKMAKGRYLTILTGDQVFDPDYVRGCLRIVAADPYAQFTTFQRVVDVVPPAPSIVKGPLVSILCYNYNYGRYLRRTLDGLFSQTYPNVEVCFSDNASTDDSWEIALEFARRYPNRMNLVRNRRNFGSEANFANCMRVMRGKYYVNFCSDDTMEPEYVERCVRVLEAHPNVGLVIVNRAMLDENDRRTEELPFYNRSCIIPGHEQAAVYMMAGVNPSTSQVMYRREVTSRRGPTGGLVHRYYGTRILDFNISLDYDIAYLREDLLLHRIHNRSDTSRADELLLPVIGMYVLNHQLADQAALRGAEKAVQRLPQSLEKLAKQALRYSVRMLQAEDTHSALKYFHLAMAIDPGVVEDPVCRELQRYWSASVELKAEILGQLGAHANLATRGVSYDPPVGSISLE